VTAAEVPRCDEHAPCAVPRWRWTGRSDLFDALDVNRDGRVSRAELVAGLPRFGGALDTDGDGRVSGDELRRSIGEEALRVLAGQPSGPRLPQGADYSWKGHAHWVTFRDREDKAHYMADAAVSDVIDPMVLRWAEVFRALPYRERAPAILCFVQRAIRYERDPAWYDPAGKRHGIELLDSSAVGLLRGYGDCDVKARLFVALCLASGVPARLDPVFRGDRGFPHVRGEVWNVETGRWEVADPSIVNSAIGRLPRKPSTRLELCDLDDVAGPTFGSIASGALKGASIGASVAGTAAAAATAIGIGAAVGNAIPIPGIGAAIGAVIGGIVALVQGLTHHARREVRFAPTPEQALVTIALLSADPALLFDRGYWENAKEGLGFPTVHGGAEAVQVMRQLYRFARLPPGGPLVDRNFMEQVSRENRKGHRGIGVATPLQAQIVLSVLRHHPGAFDDVVLAWKTADSQALRNEIKAVRRLAGERRGTQDPILSRYIGDVRI
jgi:hypothetical protein